MEAEVDKRVEIVKTRLEAEKAAEKAKQPPKPGTRDREVETRPGAPAPVRQILAPAAEPTQKLTVDSVTKLVLSILAVLLVGFALMALLKLKVKSRRE